MRHAKPVRLGNRTYRSTRLVGTVSNCAYAVRLETAPTGGRKCLFIFRIHHKSSIHQMELDKRYFGSLIS